jgi:hypothetical protein
MKLSLTIAASVIAMNWIVVYANEGVVSWKEIGRTRLEACFNAKRFADNHMPPNTHPTGHSDCECEQNSLTRLWTCVVDANWKSNDR